MIVAKGLTTRFGDFTAVNDVSFKIRRGEVFNSNGSGKTTTMKMLTGLYSGDRSIPAPSARANTRAICPSFLALW